MTMYYSKRSFTCQVKKTNRVGSLRRRHGTDAVSFLLRLLRYRFLQFGICVLERFKLVTERFDLLLKRLL